MLPPISQSRPHAVARQVARSRLGRPAPSAARLPCPPSRDRARSGDRPVALRPHLSMGLPLSGHHADGSRPAHGLEFIAHDADPDRVRRAGSVMVTGLKHGLPRGARDGQRSPLPFCYSQGVAAVSRASRTDRWVQTGSRSGPWVTRQPGAGFEPTSESACRGAPGARRKRTALRGDSGAVGYASFAACRSRSRRRGITSRAKRSSAGVMRAGAMPGGTPKPINCVKGRRWW